MLSLSPEAAGLVPGNSPSLKFRTVSFPQYGFKAGISNEAFPSERVLRSVCHRPACPPLIAWTPRSVPGNALRLSTSVRAASAALPQGPSLRFGLFSPYHDRLIGPIRPTRRHISTSPLRGLYERLIRNVFAVRHRLGDPRVVPGFPCPSFLTGDRNRFVPTLPSQPRPSSCYE